MSKSYEHLQSELVVGGLTLKNRLAFRLNRGSLVWSDRPNEKTEGLVRALSRGGVGLVELSHFIVDRDLAYGEEAGYLTAEAESVTAWRKLLRACQQEGTKVIFELSAGPGRALETDDPSHWPIFRGVSASVNRLYSRSRTYTRTLSDRKVRALIKNFVQTAKLAKIAGADGVSIRGDFGGLLSQFASPNFNRRRWGSYQNRQSLALDLIKELKANLPEDFLITYNLSVSDCLVEGLGPDLTKRYLGRSPSLEPREELLDFVSNLAQTGLSCLQITAGCPETSWYYHPVAGLPPAYLQEFGQAIKEHLEKGDQDRKLPAIGLSGKLGDPAIAEHCLLDRQGDYVVLSDSLVSDPEWFNKLAADKPEAIQPAFYEGLGLEESRWLDDPANRTSPCFQDLAGVPIASDHPLRIAVIGGGILGGNCCLAALEKGHEVWLFEAADKVGAGYQKESCFRQQEELRAYLSWLDLRLQELAKTDQFHLHLHTIASLAMLREQRFDKLVFATGTCLQELYGPKNPAASELAGRRQIRLEKLVDDPELVAGADRIVVLGSGRKAVELSLSLLADQPRAEVSLLSTEERLLADQPQAVRAYYLNDLEKSCCQIRLGVKDLHLDPANGQVNFRRQRRTSRESALASSLEVASKADGWVGLSQVKEELVLDLVIEAEERTADKTYCDYILSNNLQGQVYFPYPAEPVGTLSRLAKLGRDLGHLL